MNPYEAPQTLQPALPPQAPPLAPQLALQQGARRCALGGKFLMAAAISEASGIGVLIWIQQAKQHGTTNLLNLCGWILLCASWLLLPVGASVNLLGYARFIRYLDHEQLVKLFRNCRRIAWVKFGFVIGFIVFTNLFDQGFLFQVATIAVFASLMGLVIYSCFIHARAMRIWSEHYPDSAALTARGVFLASGIAATVFGIGLVAYSIYLSHDPSNILLIGLMLVFALSFAAFADFYGRLSKALEIAEPEEERAVAHR